MSLKLAMAKACTSSSPPLSSISCSCSVTAKLKILASKIYKADMARANGDEGQLSDAHKHL